MTQINVDIFCSVHTKPTQIPGRKEQDNLSPFGWISGDLYDNSHPLHRLLPINLRQVRSSHTYTEVPNPRPLPCHNCHLTSASRNPFYQKT